MNERQATLHTLERHIDRLERYLKRYRATSDQFSRWRLLLFLAGVVAVFFGLAAGTLIGLGVLLLWLAAFIALVLRHQRVLSAIDQFRIWKAIKRGHLARIRLEWEALPPETATPPPGHPFAIDLDITGAYSIHRLLDTTVSIGGSERLAAWLLSGKPDLDEIKRRQAIIRELIPIHSFRDRVALSAARAADATQTVQFKKWDGESLLRWLRGEQQQVGLGPVVALGSLAAVNIVLFLLTAFTGFPPVWIVTLSAYLLASSRIWSNLSGMFDEALRIQAQVRRLGAVFNHLETYSYSGRENLKALCTPFLENKPSDRLRRIGVIASAASLQRNVVVWVLLNILIPWDIFFAYQLGRSKGDLAEQLPRWLEAWYDLEALSALANLADLNPHHTFPTFNREAVIEGVQIGHPLIPEGEKVCNDFAMDEAGQVVIITGSNMAGKSSFLRALGVNLVLAYAGGAVNADQFEVGLLRLFTCIRVTDSVVDGFSYFYAEVRRLKALLEALEQPDEMPLFYLIDEIFRGTNNRERLIGSRSYIRALVGNTGAGLIATHDLELVKLADEMPAVSNYHFREEVVDGRMTFDYKLRPGPSPTTNALKIMEIEGLPVEKS